MQLEFASCFLESYEWFETYYEQVFPEGREGGILALELGLDALRSDHRIGERRFGQNATVKELPLHRSKFSLLYEVREDHIFVLYLRDRRGYRANKAMDTFYKS